MDKETRDLLKEVLTKVLQLEDAMTHGNPAVVPKLIAEIRHRLSTTLAETMPGKET